MKPIFLTAVLSAGLAIAPAAGACPWHSQADLMNPNPQGALSYQQLVARIRAELEAKKRASRNDSDAAKAPAGPRTVKDMAPLRDVFLQRFKVKVAPAAEQPAAPQRTSWADDGQGFPPEAQ